MPLSGLADYGIAIFAVAAVAWVLVSVLGSRRRDPDLARIITENTQALTKLTVLIESQGTVLQRVLERLDSLWERR